MSGFSSRNPLRVMLVDDHSLVRSAVRQAISDGEVELVAEAATAEDAFALALSIRPDILLLDINLPGMKGLQMLDEIAPRLPDTKVVMLTVSDSERDVIDAIARGASGYLTKDLSPEALLRALKGVHRGELAMSRRMAAVDAPLRRRRAAGTRPGRRRTGRWKASARARTTCCGCSPRASPTARSPAP